MSTQQNSTPAGWDEESPSGLFLKINAGETAQFRIFNPPHKFTDVYQGEEKVQFAATVLYRNKVQKITEVKVYRFGWAIYNQIKELVKDVDYGDPKDYDIAITRTGSTKNDTRYNVIPKPVRPPTPEDKSLIESCDIDLAKIVQRRSDDAPESPSLATSQTAVQQGEMAYDPYADD